MQKIEMFNESAFVADNVKLLEESTSIGELPKIKFKAKLQEANVKNNNGRMYSPEVLAKIVQQLKDKALNRSLVGEMDHPSPQGDDKAKLKRSSTISLQNACVVFTKLEFDGSFILAECETMTNTKGMELYRMLKDKIVFGFSLRAFGGSSQLPNGTIMVDVNTIHSLTFDVVSNPSHPSAVVYEIIEENANIDDIISVANTLFEHSSSEDIVEIILENDSFDSQMTGRNLDGEQVCACSLDGSCIQGTIEESVQYMLNLSLTENTLKRFDLKLF